MEALQAWLNDKKNLPIILGALAAVVVIAGVVVFFATRGPAVDTTVGDFPQPDMGAQMDPGAMPPAPGDAMMPPGMGMPAPGMPGMPGEPDAVAAPTAPVGDKEPPLEEARADPFVANFGPRPARTRTTFTAQLPRPEIRRVAPVVLDLEQEDFLPPQPQRRMAGILKNDRVFAILVEDRGEGVTPSTMVVSVGQEIGGGMTVDRIQNEKLVLRHQPTGITLDVPKAAGRVEPRQPTAPRPGGPRMPGPMGPMTRPGDGMMPPPPAP